MLKHVKNNLNECEDSVKMLRVYVKHKLILCYNWNIEIIPSNRKKKKNSDEPDYPVLWIN